jgi:hypothetical protein
MYVIDVNNLGSGYDRTKGTITESPGSILDFISETGDGRTDGINQRLFDLGLHDSPTYQSAATQPQNNAPTKFQSGCVA